MIKVPPNQLVQSLAYILRVCSCFQNRTENWCNLTEKKILPDNFLCGQELIIDWFTCICIHAFADYLLILVQVLINASFQGICPFWVDFSRLWTEKFIIFLQCLLTVHEICRNGLFHLLNFYVFLVILYILMIFSVTI